MRKVTGWAVAVIAAGWVGGCGGGGGGEVDIGQAEQDIKRDYQKQVDAQIQKAGGGGRATVDSVECVKQSDEKGRCFAVVTGDVEGRQPITITFGENGEYLWEADTSGGLDFNAAAPADESAPEDPVEPDTPAEGTGGAADEVKAALETVMEQQFPDVSLTEVLADPGLSDVSAVITVASSTAKSTVEKICDKATTSLMDQGLTTEQLSVIYGGANSDRIVNC